MYARHVPEGSRSCHSDRGHAGVRRRRPGAGGLARRRLRLDGYRHPCFGGHLDHTSAYKLFLGYEFPKILGLEAAWVNLGGHHEWFQNTQGEMHTDGWTAALTGRIPIAEWFAVYGKVGYFFWNTRFDLETGDVIKAGSNTGEDLFYGVGVRFNSGKLSFLGEYEHYRTIEQSDQKLFALAVRFTF
jgi:hypothetical protein